MEDQGTGSRSKAGFHIYFLFLWVLYSTSAEYLILGQCHNVRPEMVDLGPRQGRREFLTGGVVILR